MTIKILPRSHGKEHDSDCIAVSKYYTFHGFRANIYVSKESPDSVTFTITYPAAYAPYPLVQQEVHKSIKVRKAGPRPSPNARKQW